VAQRSAIAIVATCGLMGWACGGRSEPSPPVTPPLTPTVTVTSVVVAGTAPSVGETASFVATATLSDSASRIVTSQAAWQTSDAARATVSPGGLVTGVAEGEVDISATYEGVRGSQHVLVGGRAGPRTFSASGRVADATNDRPISSAEVEIMGGANLHQRSSQTGSDGRYVLAGLPAGDYVLRARADGYDSRDLNVTIADRDAGVDFRLGEQPCAYSIRPATIDLIQIGGQRTADVIRTSGRCSWQATSKDGWITIPGRNSGAGSDTLTYAVNPQPAEAVRTGTITLEWPGGNVPLTVKQWPCEYLRLPASIAFSADGREPTLGGTAAYVGAVDTQHGACYWDATTDASWITVHRANITFTVQVTANQSTAPRTGTVRVSRLDGATNVTIVQAGR